METVTSINPCYVKIYRGIKIQNNDYKKYTSLSSEELKKIIHNQLPNSNNYYKEKLNSIY